MKYSVIFVLLLVKFCESNDFECGLSDDQMESVEFYCTNYAGIRPENCSDTFLYTTCRYDKFKVKNLKVGGCDADEVTKLVDEFQNLEKLDLSYSRIESLDAFNFKHDNLKSLNASHNQLADIPPKFFSQMPELKEIDFSFNQLTKIDELPTKLERIDLTGNKLSLYLILQNRG